MNPEIGRNTTINFNHLHKLFSSTPDGQELCSKVRWERYRPDNMTNEEWQHLLGYDVNNMDHNLLAHYQCRAFIENQNRSTNPNLEKINPEEQQKLLLACLIHDWGEAKLGDLSQDYKNMSRQQAEMQILKNMSYQFLGQKNQEFIDEVVDIIDNPNTKLGRIFGINESLGYYQTATKAWKRSEGKMVNTYPYSDLPLRLKWLTSNVFGHQIPFLLKAADEFPFVKKCLEQKSDLIDSVFNTMPSQVFDFYDTNIRQVNIDRYKKAKQEWQEHRLPKMPVRQNIVFLINRPN